MGICLPSFNKPTINSLCHSMGWGINSQGEFKETNIMKQVRLNEVTPREDCEQQIKDSGAVSKVWRFDESWICAKAYKNESKNNILCKGDGGGPLVCEESGGEIGKERYVLSGIIAYGYGKCGTETPDVFASVQDALCFIDYDVKCKYGFKFQSHFDYQKECGNWFDAEYNGREGVPISTVKIEFNRFKRLKENCIGVRNPVLAAPPVPCFKS